MRDLTILSLTLRLVVAASVACLLGLEREIRGHPARLAAQVASGVGFLGAGAILRQRPEVADVRVVTAPGNAA